MVAHLHEASARRGVLAGAASRPIEELRVPAFLIGGLQDGYRDSIPRMLERVKAPIKAWIGPWNHGYPNDSDLRAALRVARPGGALVRLLAQRARHRRAQGSRVVIYQQHWHPPGSQAQDVPGEWRAESWPPGGLAPTTLVPAAGSSPVADGAEAAAISCVTCPPPASRRASGGESC